MAAVAFNTPVLTSSRSATVRLTMSEMDMVMAKSFHRKELPSSCISLSSSHGRQIFKEGLAQGTLETFLSISEAYQSQGEPAFCGIGSLCMSLNALLIDPGRLWKGNWRWFEDTMLDCCDPIDVMREKGTTIDRLHCLANCNGANAQLVYATSTSIDSFRDDLMRVCSTNELETVIHSCSTILPTIQSPKAIVTHHLIHYNNTGVDCFV